MACTKFTGRRVYSEQDFQRQAHRYLRNSVSTKKQPADKDGMWMFHFKTIFEDNANAPATLVDSYDGTGSVEQHPYQRRRDPGSGSLSRVVSEFHSNGTVVTKVYAMSNLEVGDEPLFSLHAANG